MRRYRIIPVIVLLLVLIGFVAVYQFYIRERSAEFRENEQRYAALAARIEGLETTFSGADGRPVKPEEAVRQYRLAVQPWIDTLDRMSDDFRMEEYADYDLMPEGGFPKFHFRDERQRLEDELWAYAQQKGVNITGIDLTFGVVKPEELQGRDPSLEDVYRWLDEYSYGASMLRRAIDSGARSVNSMIVWPKRIEYQILEKRTVGYTLQITMNNLVQFLRSFYNYDEFITIDGMKISNGDLLTQTQPLLNVELLITQATFAEGEKPGLKESEEVDAEELGDVSHLQQLQLDSTLGVQGIQMNIGGRGKSAEEDDDEETWQTRLRRYLRYVLPI